MVVIAVKCFFLINPELVYMIYKLCVCVCVYKPLSLSLSRVFFMKLTGASTAGIQSRLETQIKQITIENRKLIKINPNRMIYRFTEL